MDATQATRETGAALEGGAALSAQECRRGGRTSGERVVRLYQALNALESRLSTYLPRKAGEPGDDGRPLKHTEPSKPYLIAVYMKLVKHADAVTGDARPGVELIARACGMSVRQVKACLAKLAELGILSSTRRGGKGNGKGRGAGSNIYRLAEAYRPIISKVHQVHDGETTKVHHMQSAPRCPEQYQYRDGEQNQGERHVPEAARHDRTEHIALPLSRSSKTQKPAAYEPADLELANALQEAIRGDGVGIVLDGGPEKHARHFRLLRTMGAPGSEAGIEENRIRPVIAWLGRPGNWWTENRNIMSGATFRKQFMKLEGQMVTDSRRNGNNRAPEPIVSGTMPRVVYG